MPTKKGTAQPARTKDRTMHGDLGARLEVQRTLRQIWMADKARAVVRAGIRRGDITPRPGSSEWLQIVQSGIEAGLLRRPNGKVKR